MKRVLVFGVFDGLHSGHDAMLREARALGDELYVAVAQDSVVQRLKNKFSKRPLEERIADLERHEAVTRAVPGDTEIGTWKVLETVRPDIIACGYDQERMRDHLVRYVQDHKLLIEVLVLKPFEPLKFHSSILDL